MKKYLPIAIPLLFAFNCAFADVIPQGYYHVKFINDLPAGTVVHVETSPAAGSFARSIICTDDCQVLEQPGDSLTILAEPAFYGPKHLIKSSFDTVFSYPCQTSMCRSGKGTAYVSYEAVPTEASWTSATIYVSDSVGNPPDGFIISTSMICD